MYQKNNNPKICRKPWESRPAPARPVASPGRAALPQPARPQAFGEPPCPSPPSAATPQHGLLRLQSLPWPPPEQPLPSHPGSPDAAVGLEATVFGPFWCRRCRVSVTSEAALNWHRRSAEHLAKTAAAGTDRSRSPSPVAGVNFCVECGVSVSGQCGGMALHRASGRHYMSVARLLGLMDDQPLPPLDIPSASDDPAVGRPASETASKGAKIPSKEQRRADREDYGTQLDLQLQCTLCQINYSSLQRILDHFDSDRHRNKLESIDVAQANFYRQLPLKCLICDASMFPSSFLSHQQGRKHVKNWQIYKNRCGERR